MSASWSAGTSLKLNGETSLHMPNALAMPRRVSLAFIRFVGKESNLLRNDSIVWLILASAHGRGICQHTIATVQTEQNSHKHCKYISISVTRHSLTYHLGSD